MAPSPTTPPTIAVRVVTTYDADRVRATWQDVARPALDVTAQHLSTLAVQLQKEADDQDRGLRQRERGSARPHPVRRRPRPP